MPGAFWCVWLTSAQVTTSTIFASGNKAEIKTVNKDEGKEMVDNVRNRLSAPKPLGSSACV